MIRIIGDVHGKLNEWLEIVNNSPEGTIQVGDFGFKSTWDALHKSNVDPKKHKILGGNHEYYPLYHSSPYAMGDYGSFKVNDVDVFFVRGASSIDKQIRTEGYDWFRDEEISYVQACSAIEDYATVKPSIVISHDCPQEIKNKIVNMSYPSLTNQLLSFLLKEHAPDLWVFGHHHVSFSKVYRNTRFICVNELETYSLPNLK